MKNPELKRQLKAAIAQYDLVSHPFYKAWTAGRLTQDDLRAYAADYFHHVAAFPTYLSALHSRLPDGDLRRAVLRNLSDEEIEGSAHSDLWLDFAEGIGAKRDEIQRGVPSKAAQMLISTFRRIVSESPIPHALAALYAYESQVPRVAELKARGLRELYGADSRTCAYFTLHATLDVYHSQVWAKQFENSIGERDVLGALKAAADASRALWHFLDAIEARRMRSLRTEQPNPV